MANTLKPGKQEEYEEEDHREGEEFFDDKRDAILPFGFKEQGLYEENDFSYWMKNARIPVDYREKKL